MCVQPYRAYRFSVKLLLLVMELAVVRREESGGGGAEVVGHPNEEIDRYAAFPAFSLAEVIRADVCAQASLAKRQTSLRSELKKKGAYALTGYGLLAQYLCFVGL
jgi:hypothetical protein